MRKYLYAVAALLASQSCIAAEFATPAEAEAMVKRAVAHMQKAGREQA